MGYTVFNDIKHYLMDPVVRTLLLFSGMVVIDGYLLDLISRWPWTLADLLILAFCGYSGPASLTTAMRLKGTVRERLYSVFAVYALVALASGIVVSVHPTLTGLLPPNTNAFVGVYMIALGLSLTGIPKLDHLAYWSGGTSAMKILLTIMVMQAAQQGFPSAPLLDYAPDWQPLPKIALALSAGCALTSIGAVVGLTLDEVALVPLRRGAAASLVANGIFGYFGLPAPSIFPTEVLILGPLAVGFIGSVAVAVFTLLQKA
jgi:hypothetical protein